MRKVIIEHSKKFIAVLMVATLITTGLWTPNAFAAKLSEKFETGSSDGSGYTRPDLDDIRYKDYLQKEEYADAADYTGSDIVLSPSEAVCKDEAEGSTDEDPKYRETPLTDAEGKSGVIGWNEDYTGFTWTVDIPVSGFYNISIEYLGAADSLGINPSREIAINGIVPFTEATELTFKKWWKDEGAPTQNLIGDYVAPNLVEVREWATAVLRDSDGYYTEPFKFYFEAGQNTITLNFVNREMFLGNIILSAPEQIDDYATVSASYGSYDKSGTDIIRFEAEDVEHIVIKTSNMMRLTSSKNTTMTPFRSGYTDMNQVGDSNWTGSRDSYTWSFDVPESGLYKIALRVMNNYNVGMPVYRQIYIDGEVPFSEFLAYRFGYKYNYYTETLSDDDGNPYYIYLEAGTHTLKLETVMGPMGNVALEFYEQAENLNLIIRKIKKIIGDDPDSNYDYRLAQRIPELIPTLEGLVDIYNDIIEQLTVICQTDSSSMINDIKVASETLKECIDDPVDIPNQIGGISGLQTSMGTWITDLESSSLGLDFIEIAQPEATVSSPKGSLWATLSNLWTSFIVSFTKDYNAPYEQASGAGEKTIEVWLSRDREYADMMLSLVNSYFTPENSDFSIKVRIVPGQIGFGSFNLLLLSIMTNREPDMLWGTSANSPVNYAIRGVSCNLEQFDDFEEVAARFCDGTMIPLQYSDNSGDEGRNGTFGLPETMGISVAFYRTDIFEELGLTPPETWDDVFNKLVPAFYQNGYNMVPMGQMTFLFQMNGYPYRSQNRVTGLDTDLAWEAFQMQIDQYLVYGYDIAVQAFQGFRDGTVPYMTGGLDTYIQLSVAAPELLGKWAIASTPGIYDELGVLNKTIDSADPSTALMILPSSEYKQECWEFMKWWTSTSVQLEFATMVDAKFGMENRWSTANKEAFLSMGWTPKERAIISEMMDWYISVPTVLGSYQQDRYSGFAFNQVVIQGRNARDAIEEMVDMINPELRRKQLQYDIIPVTDEEMADKTYDVTAANRLKYYMQLREEARKAQGKG